MANDRYDQDREVYKGFSLGKRDDVRDILIHDNSDKSPPFNVNTREELIGFPRGPYGGLELLSKDYVPDTIAGYFCGAKAYNEHFCLTGDIKKNGRGKTIYRVQALKTFAVSYIPNNKALSSSFFRIVEAGDLGGWISDPLQIRYGWVFDEGEYSGKYKLDGAVMDNAVVETDFSVTQLFSFDKDSFMPERYWIDDIGLPIYSVVRGECTVAPSGGVWNSLLSGKINIKNSVVCRTSFMYGNFEIDGRLDGTYNFFVFESPWTIANAYKELSTDGSFVLPFEGHGAELEDICFSGLNKMSKGLLNWNIESNPRNPYVAAEKEDITSILNMEREYKTPLWEEDPMWEYSEDEVLAQEAALMSEKRMFGQALKKMAPERGTPPPAEDCPQEVEGEFTRSHFEREQAHYEEARRSFYLETSIK